MVYVVVLFEQGFCEASWCVVLWCTSNRLSPARSSIILPWTDRVTELQSVVHLVHESPTTTTRKVTRICSPGTRLIGPPTRIPCFSSSRASAVRCGKSRSCTFCTRRSQPFDSINLASPISMAHDKASPRKHQRLSPFMQGALQLCKTSS